ncbi:unnamed protein product, partial [Adineta ricciae]
SLNQPMFCPSAEWDLNGTIFADNTTIGNKPNSIWVDRKNNVYTSLQETNSVLIWFNQSSSSMQNISYDIRYPYGLFITNNGDLYIDNGFLKGRVDKWSLSENRSSTVMLVTGSCYSLFIDIYDNLYCSLGALHKIIKKSIYTPTNASQLIAGNGTNGTDSNLLNQPYGIFVDIALNLYVADCGNNRVQRFPSGQVTATTVTANSSLYGISLSSPTAVILDKGNNLFIMDSHNNRIVVVGSMGTKCLIGCTSINMASSSILNAPLMFTFDRDGNIFVTDYGNDRIVKFRFIEDSCAQTTVTSTEITTSGSWTSLQTNHITTDISTVTTGSMTTLGNQNCFAPAVVLIPGTSSLSLPIQNRRNQDLYISSYIQLKCNTSLSTNIQWTIRSCSSTNCLTPVQLDSSIITTFSELYLPARTLSYGLYQFELRVTMNTSLNLTSTNSAFVTVIASNITANLVQYGTSMITRGRSQDFTLDPGSFSIDPDGNVFNASHWKYEYYCRIYGFYDFPNILGSLLTIDDPRITQFNSSCLSNTSRNQAPLQFGGGSISPNSSLTIRSYSLASNQTYEFQVIMTNRQNPAIQTTGYLLARIEDRKSQMITVACVIAELCVSITEFQIINPTTQVELFSACSEDCSTVLNITWNVYKGTYVSSSIQWTLFNESKLYENVWFFGSHTSNFTATKDLFLNNAQTTHWRFEVVYTSASENSSSALDFILNQPPRNGSCSISPLNGTTSTVFNISCLNWIDEDEIKGYSIYGYTSENPEQTIIAFSAVSDFQVYLPSGDSKTSLLQLTVYIRDSFDAVVEFNLTAVIVTVDSAIVADFVHNLQNASSSSAVNPIIQLLVSGNQNMIAQIITSLAKEFNRINTQNAHYAFSNGISLNTFTVSPLNSQRLLNANISLNTPILQEYLKQLNNYINTRDYLMMYLSKLPITSLSSISLQASALAQLTQATNQLTRTSSAIASDKCYQLASALHSKSSQVFFQDVQRAAVHLAECTSNVLTAINGPLQQRTIVLDLDSFRANTFPQDYETNLELEWANPNLFANGDDFSWETIQKSRIIYYQKQTANTISNQAKETMSLLTNALNLHLNIGQNLTMNTSAVFMSLETLQLESLANKSTRQAENAYIHIPSNLQVNLSANSAVSLRSILQPLASASNFQITNLSTSLSLSILDRSGKEISVQALKDHPIELLIPRDPNIVIPSMVLQNVTAMNYAPHQLLFNLHFVDIISTLPVSVHFEMRPLNKTRSYLLIYKFDSSPQLNTSIRQIDGWSLLCPSNLNVDDIYTYFIDNQLTVGHQSVIFGIRELNSTDYCLNQSLSNPPILNEPFKFSTNYELRIYTSGCYYLDSNNNWQSDGLVVGSATNHYQTQCFSTHLTTFAGGFLVLPAPTSWNYVFSNVDFVKIKTIYVTVICISMLYFIILVIYVQYKDRRDLATCGVTPLLDNYKLDQYFYEVLFFTRTLSTPHRSILQRGGIDAFVMDVPKSIGLLSYIRIRCDNSGKVPSASWFLKYIIVCDSQMMEKFSFICQDWLAFENDDGAIEWALTYADKWQRQQFSDVLSKHVYHSVSAGHLWHSIFSRLPTSKFTRVQRCTCYFVLLVTAMLLNILYYNQANDTKVKQNTGSLIIRPFYITPEQITIEFIVGALTFLLSILLVEFFRCIRSSHPSISSLREAMYKIIQKPVPEEMVITTDKTKRSKLILPWWCLFIVYTLSFIMLHISTFFIIARGIEFGDLKTQKWLTSLLSGFFFSMFVVQPVKVIGLAVLFAFFMRSTDQEMMRSNYSNGNHIFPSKIDELLDVLNQSYMSQQLQ